MQETVFANRIVVITGISNGIGRHLAEAVAGEGGKVIGLDVCDSTDSIDGVYHYRCDVSDWTSVKTVFEQAKQEVGTPDILINNAAVSIFQKPIEEITPEEFKRVIDVNLLGTFYCCKAFVETVATDSTGKRIINFASTRYRMNEPHWEAYGASKGGVVSLTQSLAVSLAHRGITVNCIAPGWIVNIDYDQLTLADHLQHPSQRVGRPNDIFRAVRYLSEWENDFINGETLIVDGGMTKKMIYV